MFTYQTTHIRPTQGSSHSLLLLGITGHQSVEVTEIFTPSGACQILYGGYVAWYQASIRFFLCLNYDNDVSACIITI